MEMFAGNLEGTFIRILDGSKSEIKSLQSTGENHTCKRILTKIQDLVESGP